VIGTAARLLENSHGLDAGILALLTHQEVELLVLMELQNSHGHRSSRAANATRTQASTGALGNDSGMDCSTFRIKVIVNI